MNKHLTLAAVTPWLFCSCGGDPASGAGGGRDGGTGMTSGSMGGASGSMGGANDPSGGATDGTGGASGATGGANGATGGMNGTGGRMRGAGGANTATGGSTSGSGGTGAGGTQTGTGGQAGVGGTATQFAKLPYRGTALAGAEFGVDINGSFSGGLGSIPDTYYYPDKDWQDDGNYPGGYGKNAFPFYRSRGMNIFRLPFRWERLQRSLNADFNAADWADLQGTVRDMEAAGAFVLLDVHNYARYTSAAEIKSGANGNTVGSTAVPNAAFADLWRRLADQYKDDPNVLFGLMNEPFGLDSSSQWLNAANAAIAAIRGTGAKNLILIGGNEFEDAGRWPSVSDTLKDITDSGNNFAFEVHVYPDTDQDGAGDACPDVQAAPKQLQPFTDWARSHKVRGFLGEFSAGVDINADTKCMTAIDNEIAHLEQNSDVYIGWTYWAGGQGFGGANPMEYSVIHKKNSPQMDVLVKHLQ